MPNDKNGRNSGPVTERPNKLTAKEKVERAVRKGRMSFLGLSPLAEIANPAPDAGKNAAPNNPKGKTGAGASAEPSVEYALENLGALSQHPAQGDEPITSHAPEGDAGALFDFEEPPEPSAGENGFGQADGEDSIALAVERATEMGPQPPAADAQPKPDVRNEPCDTLPPPAPVIGAEPERQDTERRTAILPGLPGSPPETSQVIGEEQEPVDVDVRAATLVPAELQPRADGFVRRGTLSPGGEITEGIFDAIKGMTRNERAADKEGISLETLEFAMASMGADELRQKSQVEENIAKFIKGVPERFRPYFTEAMEIIHKNLDGYETDVERFIFERRWKYEREQKLLGSISTASDEIQRSFNKLHKHEARGRTKRWAESAGSMVPGEAIKNWAFTILSSNPPGGGTREMNVFDAYAKAVTFLLLSQHRPRTFMYALGHSEISKPYGQLGGTEGLGVLAGLDLPDPSTAKVPRPIIGLAFRLSQEVKYTSLIGWLQDIVAQQENRRNGPEQFIVGRFGYFVEQEIRDFQQAVQDAGFSGEMFFSLLNRKELSNLREDEDLNIIFEEACKSPGRMIYHEVDDVFDALEAIIGYMNLLKDNPQVRKEFLEHFLGTYPLRLNGGTFYKMFSMSLFIDKEDLEGHPDIVAAFRRDPDSTVTFYISEAVRRLQPRKSIIGGIEPEVTDDDDAALDRAFADMEEGK